MAELQAEERLQYIICTAYTVLVLQESQASPQQRQKRNQNSLRWRGFNSRQKKLSRTYFKCRMKKILNKCKGFESGIHFS